MQPDAYFCEMRKTPDLSSLAGILAIACLALPAHTSARPDTCSPDFRDIHDFQVGDVFQRATYTTDPITGAMALQTIRKYTILTENRSSPANVIYGVTGIKVRIEFKEGKPWKRTSEAYQENVEYLDVASHFLNQCEGAIVKVPSPVGGGSLQSKVQLLTGGKDSFKLAKETTVMKSIGGTELGTYRDGVLFPVQDLSYRETYVEGLGLVVWTVSSWMYVNSEVLEGYIRAGETVGVITPDSELLETTSIGSPRTQSPRTGAALRGIGFGQWNGFDLRGRRFTGERNAFPPGVRRTSGPTTDPGHHIHP